MYRADQVDPTKEIAMSCGSENTAKFALGTEPDKGRGRLDTLVVDDSEDYLDAVSRLLATYPCIGTIDRAISSSEALADIGAHRPDLMLVDIAMPELNGLDLTRRIKAMTNPPKVIIVTLYDTPAYHDAARAAGADGFVGKSELGAQLQGTIRQLFTGR